MINNNKSFAKALQEEFQKVLSMVDNCYGNKFIQYTKKRKKVTCKSDPEDIRGGVSAEGGHRFSRLKTYEGR